MTLAMAYVLLLSSVVAGGVALWDGVARSRSIPGRWAWMLALIVLAPITGFVMLAPRESAVISKVLTVAPIAAGAPSPAILESAVPATGFLERTDIVLSAGWALVSFVLLSAIAIGRWRVVRARRRAKRVDFQGEPVLLTDDLGPAVAGVREPVVFMPTWVVSLDDVSQRLLLAHELEHVRRGDTRVLMAGALLTALFPWNPVAWWMARRLRIAVELDCDRRVLTAHPGVRRYADLLLVAAGKPHFTTRFLAAHFGEHASDLERRIDAMTNLRWHWRPTVATAVATGVLLVAACEAPRPEPVAPLNSNGSKPAADRQEAADILYQFQVEKPASLVAGSRTPKYPDILREAGVEGEVLVSFVVGESGVPDQSTFKVIRATHELFATAVRVVLSEMRFTPAEVGGKKVKQVVEAPFSFAIAGSKASSSPAALREGKTAEVLITGVGSGEKPLAYVVRRGDAPPVPTTVQVVSFDGAELARSAEGNALVNRIEPQSIHGIEVFKPSNCPATMTCPLIKIRLAKGRTLQR